MAHFAKMNNENIVEQIIIISNEDLQNLEFPESEPIGQQFIQSLGLEGSWLQTSYNHNFRKNYAGIDYLYDSIRDAFIPPKPYESWILDEETCLWIPPYPSPSPTHSYYWDEDTLSWVESSLAIS